MGAKTAGMSSAVSGVVDPGEVVLSPRDVKFDWSQTPMHWMRNDPFASVVLNAAHLLLPEGERWFCITFKEALPFIEDEELRERVRGFIGQEAMHAEAHDGVIGAVLARHGVDPEPIQRTAHFLFDRVMGPRPGLSAKAQRRLLVSRLGLIAAIENLTALLGDWILNTDLEVFDADETMLDLFRWHGAEEVEHRMVAHDVAEYFGISYGGRLVAVGIGYVGFLRIFAVTTKYLCEADPVLPSYGYAAGWLKTLEAMRRGSIPGLGRIVWSGLRTLDPRFTPEVMGNTAQAVAYLATSPAARRAEAR